MPTNLIIDILTHPLSAWIIILSAILLELACDLRSKWLPKALIAPVFCASLASASWLGGWGLSETATASLLLGLPLLVVRR